MQDLKNISIYIPQKVIITIIIVILPSSFLILLDLTCDFEVDMAFSQLDCVFIDINFFVSSPILPS